MEVIKSALLTADCQLQRPIEKESSVLVDIGKVCRLLGLRCLQCVMRGFASGSDSSDLQTHSKNLHLCI